MLQEGSTILQRDGELFAAYLRELLDSYDDAPPRLLEAMRYSLLANGKRLRPALVMEAWRACGGPEESRGAALAAAAAIELVHTFSLVHDDLPCMDDDDMRRGQPANHKVFGEAMAVLAGDAMLTLAFDVLVRAAPATTAAALVRELAAAAGPCGMTGGQVLDLMAEKQGLCVDDVRQIHQRKTGTLFVGACRMGALAAAARPAVLESVTEFARQLGLAFQIVDDLLDVSSSATQLGKATQKDAKRGKITYPALIGPEASRSEAQSRLDAALSAVAGLGEAAAGLSALARFVLNRTR